VPAYKKRANLLLLPDRTVSLPTSIAPLLLSTEQLPNAYTEGTGFAENWDNYTPIEHLMYNSFPRS